MQIWYAVTARFQDERVRDEYLDWLNHGHMQAVIDGGALEARSVVVDGDDLVVLTQYLFASSSTFDNYVQVHAPALRADGQKRFPLERGVTFARQVGTVSASFGERPQSNIH